MDQIGAKTTPLAMACAASGNWVEQIVAWNDRVCELINYIIQYLLCNLTNSLVHTPLLWDDGAACVFVLRHQFNYENMLKQRHLPCTAFSLHIESRTAD